IGRGVFGPVLLQRILRRCFIGETGFLVAPENDRPARRRIAARPDIERGRTAGASASSHVLSSGRTVGAHGFPSPRYALRLVLAARGIDRIFVPRGIGGQILDGWLPMSDRRLRLSDRCLRRGGPDWVSL